jgi:hypothetical protein
VDLPERFDADPLDLLALEEALQKFEAKLSSLNCDISSAAL